MTLDLPAMSTALTLLSDEQLRGRVKDAIGLNAGIDGTTALMQVEILTVSITKDIPSSAPPQPIP
ncbi:MAG TPA: hypothetical protein K8V56_14620 [Sporosarcina psychrophila]|uniref:Uncharacterized protein n=1 Tax=Sporosarcina psychrophila TaxID=1476 RepID=A0A921G1L9_SPOPS|nr:hypothetical protein [Sporosarcina psychrophila]